MGGGGYSSSSPQSAPPPASPSLPSVQFPMKDDSLEIRDPRLVFKFDSLSFPERDLEECADRDAKNLSNVLQNYKTPALFQFDLKDTVNLGEKIDLLQFTTGDPNGSPNRALDTHSNTVITGEKNLVSIERLGELSFQQEAYYSIEHSARCYTLPETDELLLFEWKNEDLAIMKLPSSPHFKVYTTSQAHKKYRMLVAPKTKELLLLQIIENHESDFLSYSNQNFQTIEEPSEFQIFKDLQEFLRLERSTLPEFFTFDGIFQRRATREFIFGTTVDITEATEPKTTVYYIGDISKKHLLENLSED